MIYLNLGNEVFKRSTNSNIYVDKTRLIEYANRILDTRQVYICVSMPRRFSRIYDAKILCI